MRGPIVLSIYWFLCLGGLGAFLPFFSLYLRENAGLSGIETGMILAIMPLVGMFAQPSWGQLADRSGRRRGVLLVLSMGAASGYALVHSASGFLPLLVATGALAFFSTSVIPMAVSVSLASLSERNLHAFGFVRVWGTIGFLVTVVGVPIGIRKFAATTSSIQGLEPNLGTALLVASACLGASALVAAFLPRTGDVALQSRRGDWRRLMHNGPYLRLLAFAFGAYLFLHGPMNMFPIYIRSLGGDVGLISEMWVVMLLVEIPLVIASGAGLERLGARGLVSLGIAAGALRWVVCGLSTSLPLVYAVQLLHGVTVTGLILGAPLYVDQTVPRELRSTAVGILAMVGPSFGGILSNLGSGFLVDRMGGHGPALVGGFAALGLVALLPVFLPLPKRPVDHPVLPEATMMNS